MKTIFFKNLVGVLLVFIIASFSNEALAQQKNTNIPTIAIDGKEGKVSMECDLISKDTDCFTINFRVYHVNSDTEQRTLISNENVRVGDCYNELIVLPVDSMCDLGYLANGDFVYSNGTNNTYCLLDLLKTESLYQQYLISVNNLLKINR